MGWRRRQVVWRFISYLDMSFSMMKTLPPSRRRLRECLMPHACVCIVINATATRRDDIATVLEGLQSLRSFARLDVVMLLPCLVLKHLVDLASSAQIWWTCSCSWHGFLQIGFRPPNGQSFVLFCIRCRESHSVGRLGS
jgi:hypothetical protein